MSQWTDKTVVITGANGGLGRGLMSEFQSAGARVIGVGHSQISEPLPGPEYHVTDLLDEESIGLLFERIAQPWAVINTVGGFAPHRELTELNVAEIDNQFQLNLITAATLTKHALRAMRGSGRIVHTASRAATQPSGSGFAYSVSKSAVLHLVKMVAAEYASTDIRIHAVSPEIIDTPANRAAMPQADHASWARPADIARAYRFLAAPDSPAKTGTIISV